MNYYYLTRIQNREKKITLEDILNDLITEADLTKARQLRPATSTRTVCFDYRITKKSRRLNDNICKYICDLQTFYMRYKDLDTFDKEGYDYKKQFEITAQIKHELLKEGKDYFQDELSAEIKNRLEKIGLKKLPYYSFYIPKQKGGMRKIDAPEPELKEALDELKCMFENMMNGNTYHTSAFAYIKNRSAKNVLDKLQQNKSRWILKLDFSDFFGSITIDFVMQQMSKIYPFCDICVSSRGREALRNCLKLCFLEGGLPQGTPISPLLTNIIMIPIDYKLSNNLYKNAKEITEFDKQKDDLGYHLIYTRYADDINIGSHSGFNYEKVINYVQKVLEEENAPMKIKPQKTHYGNIAGKNWVLGLMYNRNMDITVGHNRKRQLKAMIANFAMDYNNNKIWPTQEVQHVMGNIAYVKFVEPEYVDNLMKTMGEKFNLDIDKTMKGLV